MTTRPLGAQISHLLKSRGTEVIFGIPGIHNMEMYRGIEEAGLTHILARHEGGAGFMADGYARATGKPGVCYVITGPGVTNLLTPLGQAHSDSVPVLAIATCLDESAARRGQLHQMKDQLGAARTVCDWAETARTPEAAYHMIDRAFSDFQTRRARPKLIEVPIALAGAVAPTPPRAFAQPVPTRAPDAGVMDQIAYMILMANRPLLIVGGGARHVTGLAEFLHMIQAVSFTTYAGRGLIAADQPLHLGATLARPGSAEIIAKADLVLVLGSELAEPDIWRPRLGRAAPMIRVDLDPEVLSDGERTEFPVQADCEAFLKALLPRLVDETSVWNAREIAATRARFRAEVEAERPGILRVAEALKAALPPLTTIYSDMTQFAYQSIEAWDMDAPNLWHHPSGFGCLGYALPAAIGGKVGLGARPVIAIAGDYGFQYTIQELATAVELGLNLPVILWDNGRLGEIEDRMIAAQIKPNAVRALNPDFLALARAYGALADQPKTLADIKPALDRAFAANRPTLIRLTPDLI
jgi:5-guanidino-2-oxopentanoate decarboxylase